MGHNITSAVEFGRGSNFAASYVEWSFVEKRPDLSHRGLHMPLVESGLVRFGPPREISACAAVTVGDAQDGGISDPRKIILKLHANLGHASATQLKRVQVDSGGGTSHSANHVDAALETCDVCRAFDKAPHAGTSAVSTFNEKVPVDLLFCG